MWEIDNKYYKARVMLCTTENPQVKIDPEGVEAVVVYYDGRSVSIDPKSTIFCLYIV